LAAWEAAVMVAGDDGVTQCGWDDAGFPADVERLPGGGHQYPGDGRVAEPLADGTGGQGDVRLVEE
jgi:hypothetical protein